MSLTYGVTVHKVSEVPGKIAEVVAHMADKAKERASMNKTRTTRAYAEGKAAAFDEILEILNGLHIEVAGKPTTIEDAYKIQRALELT